MKWLVSSACVFSVLLFTVYAAPASTGLQVFGGASGGGAGGLSGILSNIDLPGLLQGVNSFVKLIGAFCPPLSQVLDNVIQNVTSTAFRVFGRAILRSGGLGGSGGSGGGGQRVNVVLPTFPPDEDYEDDEEESTVATTFANLAKEVEAVTENASPASEIDDSANTIAKRHVRVVREAEAEAAEQEAASEDQEGAESAPEPGQDLGDVDDQDRNKRYLPFGGGDDHGSTGAGSGNFLFDIIRLVAGSGATEESDEHEHAGAGGVAEVDIQKSADGYTEGIPGPITRLFVIANRGLANLVQDLILRLAQTSERLVNFKARLITALI